MRLFLFVFLSVTSIYASAQADPLKAYYFQQIGWSIKLPSKVETMSKEQLAQVGNKGKNMMLGANGLDTSMELEEFQPLIGLRSGPLNFFSASIKKYDIRKEEDWVGMQQQLFLAMYQTFASQMPHMQIDSATTFPRIGSIGFACYTVGLHLPTKDVMVLKSYMARINGYDLGVNILYIKGKESIGRKFLTAFEHSNFTGKDDNGKLHIGTAPGR